MSIALCTGSDLQNIMHLFALITGAVLFPLLELAAVLSLLFRKGNVAYQFERLLPSGHTQLGINRCNFHTSQVQPYTKKLPQSTFPFLQCLYSHHTIVPIHIIDFFAPLIMQFHLCRAQGLFSHTKQSHKMS